MRRPNEPAGAPRATPGIVDPFTPESLGGIVARGAGDAARLRQGRIDEKAGAKLLERRKRGARLRGPRGAGQKQREDAGSRGVVSGTTHEANKRRH